MSYNYMCTYSVIILFIELNVSRMQTECFRICPHHVKG